MWVIAEVADVHDVAAAVEMVGVALLRAAARAFAEDTWRFNSAARTRIVSAQTGRGEADERW